MRPLKIIVCFIVICATLTLTIPAKSSETKQITNHNYGGILCENRSSNTLMFFMPDEDIYQVRSMDSFRILHEIKGSYDYSATLYETGILYKETSSDTYIFTEFDGEIYKIGDGDIKQIICEENPIFIIGKKRTNSDGKTENFLEAIQNNKTIWQFKKRYPREFNSDDYIWIYDIEDMKNISIMINLRTGEEIGRIDGEVTLLNNRFSLLHHMEKTQLGVNYKYKFIDNYTRKIVFEFDKLEDEQASFIYSDNHILIYDYIDYDYPNMLFDITAVNSTGKIEFDGILKVPINMPIIISNTINSNKYKFLWLDSDLIAIHTPYTKSIQIINYRNSFNVYNQDVISSSNILHYSKFTEDRLLFINDIKIGLSDYKKQKNLWTVFTNKPLFYKEYDGLGYYFYIEHLKSENDLWVDVKIHDLTFDRIEPLNYNMKLEILMGSQMI
ncbi:MAG: hypothetical protein R2883_05080 [Caldisericia bacterium]